MTKPDDLDCSSWPASLSDGARNYREGNNDDVYAVEAQQQVWFCGPSAILTATSRGFSDIMANLDTVCSDAVVDGDDRVFAIQSDCQVATPIR